MALRPFGRYLTDPLSYLMDYHTHFTGVVNGRPTNVAAHCYLPESVLRVWDGQNGRICDGA
jgi:hypothetical protein